MSMKNPVRLGFMMFMVCVVSQVVHGEQKIRCIPEEREALLQFKAAIVDHFGMLSSWTTPHCCQWEGIRCTNLTDHIIGLHLPGGFPDEYVYYEYKYMSGEIHKSLMELPQLQYLNLSFNYFRYQGIPEFLGSLKNLKYLDLSSCSFGGEIPSQFGSLSHLKYLNLASNSLNGSIPHQLGNLSQLECLDLSYNYFEGNIPSFSGKIPISMGSLFDLQALLLRNNNLTSGIPLSLRSCTKLIMLDMAENKLSGIFPAWIGSSLKKLQFLSLRSNNLYGTLPIQICYLRNIQLLDLSINYLFGKIPKCSKQMFMNEELSLLKSIDFSSNYLLEFLDLSRNQLVGSIPTSLAQINRLTMLDLSHNYLTGEIPIGTQLQSFNASSYENNLDLCGLPLEKLCIKPAQDKNVIIHHDEYSFLNNDFLISMTFGFVISFSIVFFSILFERSWRHAYFKFLNKLADDICVKVAVFR
ncbi:probably inactive leucine-rich repeat receptor-like protein kinase At2g25790 [Vigna unguiculata]|uniref:probably inactive leucine-rich repeat receptor-like protein kinase At2g25790 n=1 Tax=Vigna unguiculata TaxID=3917 RepID=UPI001015E5E1|nr:probably inactive leucine-rich repeat receptor-like protein kinase At2g25790 [Vigna unguiculata]